MSSTHSTKRRLLFLTVNSSYSHSSLALPLLHNACRDLTAWEWLRYDMTLDSNILAAVRDIHSLNCDLLVTDLYLFNRQTAMEVLQRCHVLAPQCRIAVGGPECLGAGAEELLQTAPWLDRIFRGEGEQIFREYLENFDTFTEDRIVPAVGNAIYADWVNSPYPVTDPFFVTDKPFVQIETSRGCPMQCFYCTSGGTAIRYRSMDQVREELQQLSQRGVREVRVLDRTFNLPQERGAALLKMFREEFPHMRFHLELHPQFLGAALQHELSQALPGQLHIEAGIQCLDSTVQQLSGRKSDITAAENGLAFLCRCTAFETHADLLAGLPGQKWQHILADTAKLMELGVAEIQLEILKALPGTPLRDIAPDHGIIYSPVTPYDVMKSDTMTMEEIQSARDLSRLLDLTCNHKALHAAAAEMNRECTGFTAKLFENFRKTGGHSQTVWDLQKRFLFLHDFCVTEHLEKSQNLLAFHWLQAGFPPGQGPDKYSEKADKIPEDAHLHAGDPACRDAQATRFWHFLLNGTSYYLAYNRAYAPGRPAAIWRGKEKTF